MSLREKKKKPKMTDLSARLETLEIDPGLNFPVFTGKNEQCRALLIVTE